ncbi:hypothetical protein D3C86_1270610 [compost metagenome]
MFKLSRVRYFVPSKVTILMLVVAVELNWMVSPLPLMRILFVALAPPIAVRLKVSVYGPEPGTTLMVTGAVIPQFNAAAAAVNVWKFVPPVATAELIV